MQDPSPTKRTSRWRTFSLRSFICVVTLVCVSIGWWVAATRRQKEVSDWIASFNRTPYYSYVLDAQGRPTRDADTPLRKWITNRFGVDSVYSIQRVHLDNRPAVKDITLLSRLNDLRHVELEGCQLTDITPHCGSFQARGNFHQSQRSARHFCNRKSNEPSCVLCHGDADKGHYSAATTDETGGPGVDEHGNRRCLTVGKSDITNVLGHRPNEGCRYLTISVTEIPCYTRPIWD